MTADSRRDRKTPDGATIGGIIAVTGGSGFLGAAVIRTLTARGFRVRALARRPLACFGESVEEVEGSLEDSLSLKRLVKGAEGVIHCAGITRARRDADFFAANVAGAAATAAAASHAGARIVHISSLAARMPTLSVYARSKRDSETAVAEAANNWLVLRPGAIYGPADAATLPYFRMIKAGIAIEPMTRPEPRASILYVDDVAAAAADALLRAPPGRLYELPDERPDGHSWREIGETLGEALGRRPRRIRAPRVILAPYAATAGRISLLIGGSPLVTPGKIREFFHADWIARDNLLTDAGSWRPSTPLKLGFAKTVRWYQERGLL